MKNNSTCYLIMKTTTKLGIIFLIAGCVVLTITFIPFIHVIHPSSGGFTKGDSAYMALTPRWYSPFMFIMMLLDPGMFDLGNYLAIGIIAIISSFLALSSIIAGVTLTCRKDNKNITKVISQ